MFQSSYRGRPVRLLAIGLSAVAVLGVSLGAMSLALFTDDVDVDNNSFTTGTVVLSATPATALFNVGVMMPGDNKYGQLTVANAGTASFRYSMTTSATNPDNQDLRNQLEVEVREKAAGTCAADFSGNPVVPNTTLEGAGFGSSVQGQDTGDRVLASGNEVFCFRVSLPGGTDNSYQGATTVATFTFHAEQTANN
jgi:predicted ribosomally synthesized peptide with SipW-like signal peptide